MQLEEYIRSTYRPKKIGVCTAWGSPFVWTHSAFNLMNLERPEGIEVEYFMGQGRDPARRHTWGVEQAIKSGASHICFLGLDQLHPLDILKTFTKHLEDGWPAVAAIPPARANLMMEDGKYKPFAKVGWVWRESDTNKVSGRTFSKEHMRMATPDEGDYIEIVACGSGCLIFPVELIRALEKPWFKEYPADEDAWRPAVMDTYFAYRLVTEAGGRILWDTTIDVIHLDVFPIDETYSERFHDWTEPRDEKEAVCRSL
jgi:hypothetical protein